MRHRLFASAALMALAWSVPGASQQPAPPEPSENLLKKCTLCHSEQRFLTANPAR